MSFPVYNYQYFWIETVSAINAPVALARAWMRFIILFDRLTRR